MGTLVRSYNEILDSDKLLVGGKGWAIARLSQIDVPVANGFCITSNLVREILNINAKFKEAYSKYLNSLDNTGLPGQNLSNNIKNNINQLPFLPSVIPELSLALKKYIPMTSDRIIVRSSASVEDSKKASFAGQFSSNIADDNIVALIRATRKCWQAITSPSLAAYAFAMKTKVSEISFAFLVQEFLNFDYSGVLFTRDPIHKTEGVYLLEYASGGADKLVSGRITPNRCLLKGGTESVEWIKQFPDTPHPSEEVLLNLGNLAKKSKKLFGTDQDIEWGIIGSNVLLIQSRPLTV